jgi:hypothetical protein
VQDALAALGRQGLGRGSSSGSGPLPPCKHTETDWSVRLIICVVPRIAAQVTLGFESFLHNVHGVGITLTADKATGRIGT